MDPFDFSVNNVYDLFGQGLRWHGRTLGFSLCNHSFKQSYTILYIIPLSTLLLTMLAYVDTPDSIGK